jgi:hypothetical protein
MTTAKKNMENTKDAHAVGIESTALFGIDQCPLHRKTPFGIRNVSMTQLSIARHYGGIKYNGEAYTYIPKTDELIRDDVLKWQRKNAKKYSPNVKVKHER